MVACEDDDQDFGIRKILERPISSIHTGQIKIRRG